MENWGDLQSSWQHTCMRGRGHQPKHTTFLPKLPNNFILTCTQFILKTVYQPDIIVHNILWENFTNKRCENFSLLVHEIWKLCDPPVSWINPCRLLRIMVYIKSSSVVISVYIPSFREKKIPCPCFPFSGHNFRIFILILSCKVHPRSPCWILSRDITGKFPPANQKALTIFLVVCNTKASFAFGQNHKYSRVRSYNNLNPPIQTRFSVKNINNQ